MYIHVVKMLGTANGTAVLAAGHFSLLPPLLYIVL